MYTHRNTIPAIHNFMQPKNFMKREILPLIIVQL
jgi:hypothetical protein